MTPHENKTIEKYKKFCEFCKWYKRHYGVEYAGVFIYPDEIAIEKELERIERKELRCRCDWNGQESIDENYDGTFNEDLIIS